MNLIIHDETVAGSILNQVKLVLHTERIKVADLIKTRVFQEVNDYNQKRPEYYRGLIQPKEAEVALNGYKLKGKSRIDPEKQFGVALEAFLRKEFLLIIDESQVDDPNFEIHIKPHTRISFLKLTSVIGG